MSSLDYLEVCRLCLVKDRVSVPIFEGEGDVRQIFLKITACLPVKVNREDKLPKKICDDCVYKVELCYQFWHTTANAEKQLLQWLGDVNMEDKQGYNVLNPNGMKQDQNNESRLDGTVMQQVSEHQNNMNMGMMDNMGLSIPMMMSNNTQQQITSVPMDNSGSSVQNVQPVAGPSTQTTHDQITQNQTDAPTQQEEEEESSEEEENSDDECDGDEGLPIKEESEEDPNSNRTIEPTTFVNVSLACDEAGPSGLQQQKITDMPEMVMQQTTDVDPKTGFDLLEMEGIKSEGMRDSHAFFIETSSSIAEIISTDSSKENRSVVRRLHYACDVCSFPCRTKGNLRKHMQLHKNTCKVCNELFVSSEKLELHMVVQHGEPKYTCKLCYTVIWNKSDMKKHFLVTHLDPFCNTCNACNKVFQSKYAIERHMYSQHTKLSVACTICRRVYNSYHALKAHTKLIHLKTGYQCEICKRRLLSVDSLEAHLRRHEGSRNLDSYICTTCGETFLTKNNLNKHVIIHGESNPYVCPVCQKAFEKRANQVQHILTHMSNVYECDICGLRYSRRAALIWHRKMHPGPLGKLPVIPVIGIVSEFVKNYISKTKNLPNT